MDNAMIWIIVAVAAIVVIAVIAVLARNARNRRRHVQAERIREEVGQETHRVEKREAYAEETEAKARAAKAEAEAKAAEAARLQQTAATHREAVTTSREDLDARRERADALDPKADTAEQMRPDAPAPGQTAFVRSDGDHAGSAPVVEQHPGRLELCCTSTPATAYVRINCPIRYCASHFSNRLRDQPRTRTSRSKSTGSVASQTRSTASP